MTKRPGAMVHRGVCCSVVWIQFFRGCSSTDAVSPLMRPGRTRESTRPMRTGSSQARLLSASGRLAMMLPAHSRPAN